MRGGGRSLKIPKKPDDNLAINTFVNMSSVNSFQI